MSMEETIAVQKRAESQASKTTSHLPNEFASRVTTRKQLFSGHDELALIDKDELVGIEQYMTDRSKS